jgi:hypothetical protein
MHHLHMILEMHNVVEDYSFRLANWMAAFLVLLPPYCSSYVSFEIS